MDYCGDPCLRLAWCVVQEFGWCMVSTLSDRCVPLSARAFDRYAGVHARTLRQACACVLCSSSSVPGPSEPALPLQDVAQHHTELSRECARAGHRPAVSGATVPPRRCRHRGHTHACPLLPPLCCVLLFHPDDAETEVTHMHPPCVVCCCPTQTMHTDTEVWACADYHPICTASTLLPQGRACVCHAGPWDPAGLQVSRVQGHARTPVRERCV